MRTLPPTLTQIKESDDLVLRRRQVESFLILQRLQRAVQDRTTAHLRSLNLTDITPSQANVLMVLFQRRRPMSARDIHRELGVSEVTISRLVGTLVSNQWVAKTPDPKDGRAALLSPTKKARTHLPDFIQIANSLLDETFDGISHVELSQLHSTIRRIDENLSTPHHPSAEHKT